MNKIVLLTALSVAPLIASESFGGIGVSIYQSHNGVKIAEVIPGTPAAESNLRSGDIIIAVDGIKLKDYTFEESKARLRGQKDKPLEITYVSKGDTLSTILRRTQITVRDLESERVEAWYGDKSEFNAHELETYAGATENSMQLVAVMQNGSVVKSDASVSAKSLNGIYVDRVDEFAPKEKSQNVSKLSSARLKMLTRSTVAFELKSPGRAVVSIMDADGTLVAKLVNENAQSGYNILNWDSGNVPSGRYMVMVEYNGSVNGKYVLLK